VRLESTTILRQVEAPRTDLKAGEFVKGISAPRATVSNERRPWRKWVRPALFSVLPVVLLLLAYKYVAGGQWVSTDDAYVEADTVGVSTDISGVVKDVEVSDNERVKRGQVLYRLDDLPFQLALQRTQAQVELVRNNLAALKANYHDVESQVRQARFDLSYYDREGRRQQYLNTEHVASEQAFDAARRNRESAQQKLTSLIQQLAAIAANLNGDPTLPVEQHPQYRDSVAQRAEAARQLEHTIVRAAFDGVVTSVPSIAPGKYLPTSTTAFYLVATDHVWIDSSPKETELTYVRAGQPAVITADTYPQATWHGTIESISPAAAQQFSLLPAQNTSGNWVKVVQRIPMRVRVDTRDANLPPLRAGMSVEVAVNTGHRRGFPSYLNAMFKRHPGA
jgi:membrane fusion protein (multidrug efflux system)